MESLALGELRLEVDQFYYLNPREFYNLLKGYRKKEFEKEKSFWLRTRLEIYYTILPYTKQKKVSPEDILQFPWEEKPLEKKRLKTPKELQEIFKKKE